jgi:hypothetical protein
VSNRNALAKPVAPVSATQRTSRWSGAAALIGTAVVAATVLVALRNEPEPAVSVALSDQTTTGATVSLWTQLDVEDIEAAADDAALFALEEDAIESVQVPDWMFAAIETDIATSEHPAAPATDSPVEADKDS